MRLCACEDRVVLESIITCKSGGSSMGEAIVTSTSFPHNWHWWQEWFMGYGADKLLDSSWYQQ